MKVSSWFTLVETVIVVAIVGILLLATFSLSFSYVNTMRVKTDKEQLITAIADGMAIARTSNYYTTTRYATLAILLTQSWVDYEVVGGDFASPQNIDSFDLQHSVLNLWTWVTTLWVDIVPYSIWCDASLDGVVSWSWLVYFSLQSTISDEEYCYAIDQNVCKVNQVWC